MMKKWLLLKNVHILRLEYKNHTLCMTKTAEKPHPLGPHIVPPPPPPLGVCGVSFRCF